MAKQTHLFQFVLQYVSENCLTAVVKSFYETTDSFSPKTGTRSNLGVHFFEQLLFFLNAEIVFQFLIIKSKTRQPAL